MATEIQLANGATEGGEVLDATNPSSNFWMWGPYCVALLVTRVLVLRAMQNASRSKRAEQTRITKKPVITEKQHKRESVWPIGFTLDTVLTGIFFYFQIFSPVMPILSMWGIVLQLVIHCTIVEFIYYWLHRALHWKWIFKQWHQYHHASVNTEPTTGFSFEIGERLTYIALFAITPVLTAYLGYQSWFAFAFHQVWFDIMNEIGHINFEFFPVWFMDSPLSLFWYTPSYHSIHHTRFKKNYSLFMPWPDMVFGTADMSRTYDTFHKALKSQDSDECNVRKELRPTLNDFTPKDFAFILHPSFVGSYLHSRYIVPSTDLSQSKFEGVPWRFFWTWPILCAKYIYLSFFDSIGYHLEDKFKWDVGSAQKRELSGETYVLCHPGMDYFMPFKYAQINRRIGNSILCAQKRKTRVIGLAALNKAEWLNHGGVDIINALGDRLEEGTVVTHGDTLTAAVVMHWGLNLRERNFWRHSAFIIGATSKIGRAIALGLAARHIPVLMFTQSKPRFEYIKNEAGENGIYLTQATTLAEGRDSDLWITGKFKPQGKELLDGIPQGSTVLNFAVPDPLTPALVKTRPDILHIDGGYLGFDTAKTSMEFSMLLPQGKIYACMAGCVTHAAAGYTEHEIGPVDMDKIDEVWDKAMEIGFKLPEPSSFGQEIQLPKFRIEEV